MHIAIYVLLLFCACSDRSTGPIARAVETVVERWPNGRLRAEYRYFVDGKGEIIRHGYYREYSRLSAGLLIAEGQYEHGRRIGAWYERCAGPVDGFLFANGDFETGDFTGWRLEGARASSIRLIGDTHPLRGIYSAQLTLHAGDIVRSGNRVELVRPDSGRYGQERIYSWSFKVDADYIEEPYWQAICQFHSQPDFAAGETWETYPEHKPPLSILYADNRCRLMYHSFAQIPQELGSFTVEKGQWFDVFFQIKWSLHGDGYIEMYANGQPVTPFNGTDYKFYSSNVYNTAGNYVKIGLYRDLRARATNSVYVDDLIIEGC